MTQHLRQRYNQQQQEAWFNHQKQESFQSRQPLNQPKQDSFYSREPLREQNRAEVYRFQSLPPPIELNAQKKEIEPKDNYNKQMDKAKEELLNFKDKFDKWKTIYDEEIGKTKADLANLTPRLIGLGLASRIRNLSNVTSSTLSSRASTPCFTSPGCGGTSGYDTAMTSTPRSTNLGYVTPFTNCGTPRCMTPIEDTTSTTHSDELSDLEKQNPKLL